MFYLPAAGRTARSTFKGALKNRCFHQDEGHPAAEIDLLEAVKPEVAHHEQTGAGGDEGDRSAHFRPGDAVIRSDPDPRGDDRRSRGIR